MAVPSSLPLLVDVSVADQLRAGQLRRRVPQLLGGLVLFGFSLALMVQGALGVAPWDVLHLALTRLVPLTIGEVTVVASFVILLVWIPLRERPGIGTVANALVVGLSADLFIALLARPEALELRVAYVLAGVALNGLATALYIGAQFGRGPRDGLMTGLARRTGASLRLVRTGIEVTVVALGVALGGHLGAELGLGTVLYALLIGPIAQAFLPLCAVRLEAPQGRAEVDEVSAGSR